MSLQKITPNVTLSKKVEDQIREAILTKVFKPGDRIPSENELVETFGVSRTAIREAIHRLAGEGLLDVNGRYGIYVAKDNVDSLVNPFNNLLQLKFGDMSHLYLKQARKLFEPDIARVAAANRTTSDLKALHNSLEKMIANKNDRSIMLGHDIDFHRHLANATKNPIIPIMMEPIFSMLGRFIGENYQLTHAPDAAISEHETILRAVEIQDEEEAAAAMTIHMQTAEKHLLEHYKI